MTESSKSDHVVLQIIPCQMCGSGRLQVRQRKLSGEFYVQCKHCNDTGEDSSTIIQAFEHINLPVEARTRHNWIMRESWLCSNCGDHSYGDLPSYGCPGITSKKKL